MKGAGARWLRLILIAGIALAVFTLGHRRGLKIPRSAEAEVTDFVAAARSFGRVAGVPGGKGLSFKNLRVNGVPVTVSAGSLDHGLVANVLNYYRTQFALYKKQSVIYQNNLFGFYSVIRTPLGKTVANDFDGLFFEDSMFGVVAYSLPGEDTVYYHTLETGKGFSLKALLEQADDRRRVPDPAGLPHMPNGVREMISKGDELGRDTWTILYSNPGTVAGNELFYRRGFTGDGWTLDPAMEKAQSQASSLETLLYFHRGAEECYIWLSPGERVGETSAILLYARTIAGGDRNG